MKKAGIAKKSLLNILGFIIGAAFTTFLVFQILFLMRVIPHGGI